jgi:hypothetical protein
MAKKESTINNIGKIMAPWIVGEYKWVKIGTPMPAGWEKVALEQGHTLVGGTSEGTTSGQVINHTHDFSSDGTFAYSVSSKSRHDGNDTNFTYLYDKTYRNVIGKTTTTVDGGSNNLAAGMYAELWVYVGE